DRDHHQKERAEIPECARLVEDPLRPPVDAAVEPHKLRAEARRGGKLEVKIDTREQSGRRSSREQHASRAQIRRPPPTRHHKKKDNEIRKSSARASVPSATSEPE